MRLYTQSLPSKCLISGNDTLLSVTIGGGLYGISLVLMFDSGESSISSLQDKSLYLLYLDEVAPSDPKEIDVGWNLCFLKVVFPFWRAKDLAARGIFTLDNYKLISLCNCSIEKK